MAKNTAARPRRQRDPGINDDIGEDMRLTMYRLQVEIREASSAPSISSCRNLVKGTSHLSLGQEAWRPACRGHEAGRPVVLHLSRPRPHARPRRADREGVGRADAARTTG